VALTLAAIALSSWLDSTERVTFAQTISDEFAVGFLLCVWAGAWAFGTRIVAGRFRFLAHLAVGSAGVLGGMVALGAEQYLTFLMPGGTGQSLLSLAAISLLAATVLNAHLALVGGMAPRRRHAIATGIILTTVTLGLFAQWADREKFSTSLNYAATLKPLRRGLAPAVSPKQFVVTARELRDEVDSLAAAAE